MWRRVVLVAGLVVVVACGDDDAAEVSSATSDVTATTGAATTELPRRPTSPSGEESSWVLLDDFESGSLEGWQVAAVNGGWNAYGESEQTLASFPPAPPQGGLCRGDRTDRSRHTDPVPRRQPRGRDDVALVGLLRDPGSTDQHAGHARATTAPSRTSSSASTSSSPAAPFDSVADGDVLLDVFATEPGDPLSLEPTEVAVDVAEIAGRTVRLRIAQVDNQGPMSAGVDNIRFESTGVDRLHRTAGHAGGAPAERPRRAGGVRGRRTLPSCSRRSKSRCRSFSRRRRCLAPRITVIRHGEVVAPRATASPTSRHRSP